VKCEDFPCCGHALGECPNGEAKECPDCGRMFMPCSLGEIYCLPCGSRPFGAFDEDLGEYAGDEGL
jgi:hypothetical protein